MKKYFSLFYILSFIYLLVTPLDTFGQDNLNSSSSSKVYSQKHSHDEQTAMNAPQVKTPLTFIENKNQWDKAVKYRATIPSGFLFARQNSLQYSFYDGDALKLIHTHGEEQHEGHRDDEEISDIIKAHSFEVEFENANLSPTIVSAQAHKTKFNYILGNNPDKWAENARGFGTLTYQDLYPNIDLHLYLKEDNLKYDFIVAPNTDASKIKMNYKYTDKVSLENGHLYIKTSINTVIEQAPYCYQIINGQEIKVTSKFVLNYKKGKNKQSIPQVTFEFPEGYNKDYELVIDPVLIFSTFSGSEADNWGNTATYDNAGNLYSGGTVFGTGFPVTTGAFDVTFSGEVDVAILKYNAQGTGVFYATYLGGNLTEVPSSMVVNSRDELIILGVTGSANFPTTTSAYDNSFGGGSFVSLIGYDFSVGTDIFISKLNSAGSTLTGSTLLGGQENDGINRITFPNTNVNNPLVKNYGDEVRSEINIDAFDNIYIASTTNSLNFPMVSAHRTTFQGRQEGVGAKFNSNLTSLLWSTYIGGNSIDAAFGIQIASTGDIYIVGGTLSNDLTTHGGTMQSDYRGNIDGFIVRYASNFAWQGASYLGTAGYDQAYYVDIDNSDNVYVFGQTQGSQPVTSGVYFNDRGGLFIRKISSNLNNTLVATVVGSGGLSPNITPTAFMINDCGNIYLAGWGSPAIYANRIPSYLSTIDTRGLPVTSNALQSTTDGNDFYIMILSENAQDLVYGSFFGGRAEAREHVDGGTSRFDKKTGTIYQAVCACTGSGFTTTPDAFSRTNKSNVNNCNNAAFKIELGVLEAAFVSEEGNSGCVPFETTFVNQSIEGLTYEWDFGGLGVSTQADNVPFTFDKAGTYEVRLIATNPFLCIKKDTAFLTIEVAPADFEISPDTVICKGQSIQLEASGGIEYLWSPSTGLNDSTIANPIATPTETTTYTLTTRNAGGCTQELTTTITVLPELLPSFTFTIADPCSVNPVVSLTNTTQNATSHFWDFGNGQTSTAINPPSPTYEAGTYIIKLVSTNDICNDKDSVTQEIIIAPVVFTFSGDTTICSGQSVLLNATGGNSYEWSPATGLSNPTIGNPIASPTETTTYTVKAIGRNGCEEERQITVRVGEEIIPNFDIVQSNLCNQFPTVSIVNNTIGATSYLWDFGNGQTSTAQNLTNISYDSAGNYRIKLITRNVGCSDSLIKELDYFINDFFVSPSTSICLNQSLQLEAGQGTAFSWSPSAGLSDPTISNPIARPTQTTTYTVSITTANGCVKEEEVTITVLPELKPDFDVVIVDRCDNLPTVEIVNNSVGATSFFWDFGDGRTSTLRNPAPFQYSSEGNYQIKLRVENSLCQDSITNTANSVIDDRSIFLSRIKMPTSPTFCRGEGAELNVIGGDLFEWTPAVGLSDPTIRNPIASPDQTTTYNVRISNIDGGCFTDSTVTVTVVDKIVLNFDVTHSPECGAPATILFNSNNTGTGNWVWDLGNGDSINVSNPTEYTYTEAGTYTIKVKGSNGFCDEEQTTTVTVDNVLPPNVITPNGDGLNETFVLDKANIGWKLKIYNRWGEEVFSADDYNNDWGNKAKPAMYYYYLTSPDGDTCRGWIQVLQ